MKGRMKMTKIKQRFKKAKPHLQNATNEELFTELISRITPYNGSSIYFIDSSSTNHYPQWSLYNVGRTVHIKEIKN